MAVSKHTALINSAIALCKKDGSWIHPLADLGHKAKLIEQTIGTETGGKKVRPDVVVASERLIHSIVIECKGGRTLSAGQISRYKLLKPSDLLRWYRIHDPNQHTHDICLLIYKKNEATTPPQVDVPVLSISETGLERHNDFSISELNRKFDKPISIPRVAPVSYYPFSPRDGRRVIVPHALRTIRLAVAPRTGQTHAESIVNDDIMRKIHKMWDILSKKHQASLKNKVQNVIGELRKSHPALNEFLDRNPIIEKKDTSKLNRFSEICDQVMNDEMRATLDDFSGN